MSKNNTKKKEVKYPAGFEVHTPSGITYACKIHAEQIIGLMRVMGVHANANIIFDLDKECMNCKNEAEEKSNV